MSSSQNGLWGGSVALLAGLGIVGAIVFNGGVTGQATGGSSGCSGEMAEVPDEVPSNVLVDAGVSVSGAANAPVEMSDWLVDDEYLVKLTVGDIILGQDGEVTLSAQMTNALAERGFSDWDWAIRNRDGALIEQRIDLPGRVSMLEGDAGTLADGSRVTERSARTRGDVPVMEAVPGGAVEPVPHLPDDMGAPSKPEEEAPLVEHIIVVRHDGNSDVPPDTLLAQLEELSGVQWAEQVSTLAVQTKGEMQSLAGYQWNLAALGISDAHEITEGEGVKVALVDSGISATVDGFRSLRRDLCFDALAEGEMTCDDEHGHGTHLAGIIAQDSTSHAGLQGMAPAVELIPVKVTRNDGIALNYDVVSGIVHAVDQGATVINVGMGGYADSSAMEEAVAYARGYGAIVIAPAGNDSRQDMVMVPARIAKVVGVGGVTMDATVAPYSNRGAEVDIFAPAGTVGSDEDGDGLMDGILATSIKGGRGSYGVREGTSVASAHVAGTIALMASAMPDRTPETLLETLLGKVDPVANEDGSNQEKGMVMTLNALRAFQEVMPGTAKAGEKCTVHSDCLSMVCEGQGCGDDQPGTCAPVERACRRDLKPYCGCDGKEFLASSDCPQERFKMPGTCQN